jgi:hypothetical protein
LDPTLQLDVLQPIQAPRHARWVRHATEEDLDHIEDLLDGLRSIQGLRERRRGYFSRGTRAFAHFHTEADEFYVDVKFGGAFERLKITSQAERAEFLQRVRNELHRETAR